MTARSPWGLVRRWAKFAPLFLVLSWLLFALLLGDLQFGPGSSLAAAKVQSAILDLKDFEYALSLFSMRHGRCPTREEGLGALYTNGILKGDLKQDPWGHPYLYMRPGRARPDGYDLVSLGSDGKLGGEGEAADMSLSASCPAAIPASLP